MINLGLYYYRSFFRDFHVLGPDFKDNEKEFPKWLKEAYSPLLDAMWEFPSDMDFKTSFSEFENTDMFQVKTIYPGLVCGIGYEHELSFQNEFKLGFAFDYTTGLPYIAGSSVKGMLRSYFQHHDYLKKILIQVKSDIEKGEYHKYNWLEDTDVNELVRNVDSVLKIVKWEMFENQIFEGKNYRSGKTESSVYTRDVFLDAYISDVKNRDRKFMDDDYITCHQNRKNASLSPFTNPVPVRFIKVSSNVVFEFHFRLTDTWISDNLVFKKELKKAMFYHILFDMGIGAKTNVGYGQFEPV